LDIRDRKQLLNANLEKSRQSQRSVKAGFALAPEYATDKRDVKAGTIGNLPARVGTVTNLDRGWNSAGHSSNVAWTIALCQYMLEK
jgi:hypothetical protein